MIVQTTSGAVQGLEKDGILTFFGIPYAQSPVGSLRFRHARPLEKSGDLIRADHFGPKAPQPASGMIVAENDLPASEDCLFLNIWTPESLPEKKPVVVWIHGGAFVMGETAAKIYDGLHFSQNGNVVFVSIQYRLGIFGFSDFHRLNDGIHRFDANCGLSDQIMALRWIRENIAAFGGDPENLTLMGESAGATSILALMVSRKAKGLFHKAIVQSPVPGGILTASMADFWGRKTLEYLGLTDEDPEGLSNISVEKAVGAAKSLMDQFTDLTPGGWPIGPVMDNEFLDGSLVEAFEKGLSVPIPMIIGTNKDEAANFVRDKAPWLPSNPAHLDRLFALNPHLDRQAVLGHYPDLPSVPAFRKMGRDLAFAADCMAIAEAHSRIAPTYVYRFDFETVIAKKLGIGAFHGAEIMYAFGNLDGELAKLLAYETDRPMKIVRLMHSAWLRFIKTGNPNPQPSVFWTPYGSLQKTTLSIDSEPALLFGPDQLALDLWGNDRLYCQE